ncbi:MAG: bifunctional UDP-N-acetylmuramoyl-tripeptide:D-alanyl-D-alanine ligase/alanine racemase [Bacteroidetes bacterium]|nr:bifunctional UDP-N-acetylmuramoyl-tripeptide:D-alanyl-D-alanine ligase/alanine racemase [Bacteroidota bacterium]
MKFQQHFYLPLHLYLDFMEFTLENIISNIPCTILGKIPKDLEIRSLLFDSRRLNNIDSTVFFAIKTPSNNGEKYINELYHKGVRVFIVKESQEYNIHSDISQYKNACFVIVEDVVEILQLFAISKRNKFNIPVIAITGSNGKTIVKDWLVQMIDGQRKICYSPRSFNSQIGVGLSVWNLSLGDEIGIFEAGISQKGEMQRLEKIIKPSIGIFTNIGDAHQTNFSSIEEKIDEKLILFKDCKQIIYCIDKEDIHKGIIKNFSNKDTELISWGFNPESKFHIIDISSKENTSTIHYIYNSKESSFSIPFIDQASIENSINAFIACLVIGLDRDKLIKRAAKLQSLEMRLEMKEGINGTIIINDSYSSDLMSLEMAMNFLNQQSNDLSNTVILSDITQSFTDESQLYMSINRLLIDKKINKLIGIGNGFKRNKDLISIDKDIYASTEEFLKKCSLKSFKDQNILIKGARSFEFEKIGRFFEKKAHETVLEINLTAIAHNANYFKAKLGKDVKLMAMVKAHSYGCGGFEIASMLANQNLDYLAVAFADEGVELRTNGIKLPIMVMSPEKESISKIIHYDLEPEVYSIGILNKLIIARKEYAIIGEDKPLFVHIKLDTGMHRLGMQDEELDSLISILKENPEVKVKSIFSHLAGADNPELDYFTLEQISLFEKMSNRIINEFDYKIMRHIDNSAGITRFPEAHYDMVRLGIGMYGVGVNDKEQEELRFVHKLKTTITQIREVKANDSVGYNRNFLAKENIKVGVIPIGYADGLSRRRGNGNGKVWVNGSLAPIIGNVCMDMCMIDLSGIECSERDDVIIFGEEYTVNNIAKELDTIAYEVFTSISTRVKRVFYQE